MGEYNGSVFVFENISDLNDSSMEDILYELNDEVAMELLPVILFIGVLVILGVVGNSVAIYVFSFRLRKSTQNFLIATLAVFDVLTSLLSMPMEIVVLRYFYTFRFVFMCRLLRFLQVFTSLASCLTLGIIGIDRFVIRFF